MVHRGRRCCLPRRARRGRRVPVRDSRPTDRPPPRHRDLVRRARRRGGVDRGERAHERLVSQPARRPGRRRAHRRALARRPRPRGHVGRASARCRRGDGGEVRMVGRRSRHRADDRHLDLGGAGGVDQRAGVAGYRANPAGLTSSRSGRRGSGAVGSTGDASLGNAPRSPMRRIAWFPLYGLAGAMLAVVVGLSVIGTIRVERRPRLTHRVSEDGHRHFLRARTYSW